MKDFSRISALLFTLLAFCFYVKFQPKNSHWQVAQLKKSFTINSFEADSLKYEEGEAEFENPVKRLLYEYQMMADPKTGKIPLGIREKELAFAKKLGEVGLFDIASRASGTDRAAETTFLSRGPYHLGGRTRALAIDIDDESVIVAGGVSGGVWRSADDGKSWTRSSSVMQLPSVTTVVQDHRSGFTDTWFYAAGEFIGNTASVTGAFYLGNGIFKSTDNAQSWKLIENTSQDDNTTLGDFGIVNALVIDYSNSNEREMYAAIPSAIIRTTDDFETYSVVLGANNTGFAITDIAVASNGVLVATIGNDVDNGPNAQEGIYISTDGFNWQNINPPSGLPSSYSRIEIAFDPQNENIFYAVGGSFLYKLSAGGAVNLSSNLPVSSDMGQGHNTQGGYDLVIAVHPGDGKTVFVGGTNLLRSTDAFNTENLVNIGGYIADGNLNANPTYPGHHADQQALAFYPSNPNRMLTGTDGGIHRTENNKETGPINPVKWESLNNGYLTTQVYGLDFYKFDRGDPLMVAGMQDNGTWGSSSLDPQETWVNILDGDGGYNALTYNSLYVSSQEGQMRRMVYNDTTSTYDFAGNVSPSDDDSDFLFINPFIYDPVNQDKLYVAAAGKIFYTNDIRVNPGPGDWRELPFGGAGNRDFVSALAASIQPEGILYFGTRAGKVYKVENTKEMTEAIEITAINLPQQGSVTSITVDPRDADKVFLTYGNYGIISIWMSEDGGQSWFPIAGNLEEKQNGEGNGPSVRSFEILPDGAVNAKYFVGTSSGLYTTDNLDIDNTVWTREGANAIGNSVVSMVKARPIDGQILVGTHGNGVYQAGYDVEPLPTINYSLNYELQEAIIRGPVSYTTGEAFTYQWIRNGEDMEGETSDQLQTSSAGEYQLRVTDELGPVVLSNIVNIELDDQGPIVTSIQRLIPTEEEVEAKTVTFLVNFNEPVIGLKTTSFEVAGAVSGTVGRVEGIQNNTSFRVIIENIEDIGLLDLNILDDSGITDDFHNPFAGEIQEEETYTILDLTPPKVTISRSYPVVEVTNRKDVVFSVMFNEAVKNVDVRDFRLSSASITVAGTSVSRITNSSYQIRISDYIDEGPIEMEIVEGTDIQDASGNLFEGEVISNEGYTISSSVAPTVQISRSFPTVEKTNRKEMTFKIQFSEDVEKVDLADFKLSTNSIPGTLSEINQQSADVYLLTLNEISTEGLIDLDVNSPVSIETGVGNLFTGTISSEETYTSDFSVGPTVGIFRRDPLNETTNQAEVSFEVKFSGDVTKVDLTDFELSANSVEATILRVQAETLSTYLVTVGEIKDDGFMSLSLKEESNIESTEGNLYTGTITSEEGYIFKGLVTSIDDPFKDQIIRVEENPSSGIFKISLNYDLPLGFDYSVVNASGLGVQAGSVVRYKAGDVISIDLSVVTDGLYIFRLGKGSNFQSVKLLKRSK